MGASTQHIHPEQLPRSFVREDISPRELLLQLPLQHCQLWTLRSRTSLLKIYNCRNHRVRRTSSNLRVFDLQSFNIILNSCSTSRTRSSTISDATTSRSTSTTSSCSTLSSNVQTTGSASGSTTNSRSTP